MKIAYVVNDDITQNSGVINKIQQQIRIWKDEGHTVFVYSLSATGETSLIEDGVIVGQKVSGSYFKVFFNYFKKVFSLKKVLQEYNPDIIYMRSLLYWPFLISAIKNFPYIIEINSSDVNELKIAKSKYYFFNQLTRNFLFQNATAFISVSKELMTFPEYQKFRKPYLVIGNGINISAIKHKRQQTHQNPKIIFVGSPNQTWHGLDKLYILCKKLTDFEFVIVGPSEIELTNIGWNLESLNNVNVTGYINQDDVEKIIADCNIGISTLALHRNNMTEASPLKSRQYLAQGLAMIVGYDDTDISNENEFILDIGNYENNVIDNLDKIQTFCRNSIIISPRKIQDFATNNLDVTTKEKQRLKFFYKVINPS